MPDATLRMGGGFREDRGNARYDLPPNPDKSCAAANVIDETTHEMYKGTQNHPAKAHLAISQIRLWRSENKHKIIDMQQRR